MSFRSKGRAALARFLRLDLTHGQRHYAAFLDGFVVPGARWLDVGCGRQIIPEWGMLQAEQRVLVSRSALLVGIDVDEALVEHPWLTCRVYGLGGALPFRDGSFDLVTANMVVEHVGDCPAFLADINRVLRPGGRFVFHTPNYHHYAVFIASLFPEKIKDWVVWVLERRSAKDRFVTYYRMNALKDIRRQAEAAGFQVERLVVAGSSGSFGRLDPLGWLECFFLKAVQAWRGGRYQSSLLCALRKP